MKQVLGCTYTFLKIRGNPTSSLTLVPGADEVGIRRRKQESSKIYGEDQPLTWKDHHISSYDYMKLYTEYNKLQSCESLGLQLPAK